MKYVWLLCLLCVTSFATVPDAPSATNGTFVKYSVLNLSAAFADGYISARFIRPKNNCHEINPILGQRPSATATYAMTIGTAVALCRNHRHWKYLFSAESAVHAGGIGLSVRNCL